MAYIASTGVTTAVSRGPKAPCWNVMRISRCAPTISANAIGVETSAVSRTQVRSVCRHPAQSLCSDHAREMRHHRRRNRAGQQRDHHAHKAIGIGQRGDAPRRQHGGHRLIHQQAARGHHAAQQHRPILVAPPRAWPRSFRATTGESDSRARPSSTPPPPAWNSAPASVE